MISVTVERTIRRSPDDVLAFVLDVAHYAEVDDKIGPIDWVRQDGEVTEFRFRSRLPGLPGPAPKVTSRMRLTPGERIDIAFAPLPANRLSHLLTRFSASFVCTPTTDGTTLARTVDVGFRGPLRWLVEPILRRTLPPDLAHELDGAKRYLERQSVGDSTRWPAT